MALTDEESCIGQWAQWHAIAMLAAIAGTLILGRVEPLILTVLFSFAAYTTSHRQSLSQIALLGGYANQLTLLRLVLLCVAAIGISTFDRLAIFGLFSANVALDVLDGFVARRRNQDTDFGAALDRETDAVFVLIACLYFRLSHDVGLWILVPAVLPYFYRIVVWALGEAARPESKRTIAARLAGINFALLLFAVLAPDSARLTVLIISAATVVFSFMISFRDLFRYRNANSVL